ncbi:hypothetical protein D3C78_1076330 [compost metagenome]
MILSGKPGELFANLTFKTSVCGPIIARLCHLLREIFLARGVGIWLIVCITIFLPIAHLFHELSWRIAQMNRYVIIRTLPRIRHRGFKGGIDGITFWRTRQINNGLSDGALPFGRAYSGKTVPG